MTDDNPTSVDEVAARWLSIVQSDGASDHDLAMFETWLQESQAHKVAFDRLEGIFSDVSTLTDLKPLIDGVNNTTSEKKAITAPFWGKWFWKPAALATVAMVAFAFFLVPAKQNIPEIERYATIPAETRVHTLSDGTQMTLGAKSTAEIAFTDKERTLNLQSGEAYFDVTSDVARPFRISAGSANIVVVGTAFAVTLINQDTFISVSEGIVSVSHEGQLEKPIRLIAGEAVRVEPDNNLMERSYLDLSKIATWRQGRLVYDNASLEDVVAGLNRYLSRPVKLSPTLQDELTLTGSFQGSDSEVILRTIAEVHDLDVTPDIDGIRKIQHKEK